MLHRFNDDSLFYRISKITSLPSEWVSLFISLLNTQRFHTAVHTGVTIWTMSQSSHHYEAISKASRWLLCSMRKHCHSVLEIKTSPSIAAVVCFLFYIAGFQKKKKPCGEWCILYNQQFRTQNQPSEVFFSSYSIRKRTVNINIMRSGTRKLTCFPKYTSDHHKHNTLLNIRTVQINMFLAHILKVCCFISLCDYLFICLLIYFSSPQVQRACIWCAPMAVFTKGEGSLLQHSGQKEEKETCLLICGCIIKAFD